MEGERRDEKEERVREMLCDFVSASVCVCVCFALARERGKLL